MLQISKVPETLTVGEHPLAHIRVNVVDAAGALFTKAYTVKMTKFIRE